jgi:DsbC/DsbD-like thiol-disulfide interchange protein
MMIETDEDTPCARRVHTLVGGAVAFALSLTSAAICLAAPATESPWVKEPYSKVRLVSGAVGDNGSNHVLAGVQIRLAPGWKTYWRTPGDSGVPPSFDWSGSKNLKQAEVLYPSPHRFPEAGGTAIGYADEVVFPIKVTPERPDEPVELKVSVDYGLCKTLCIPNQAILSLELPPALAAGDGNSLLLERYLALVPKPVTKGDLPAIGDTEAKLDGDRPELLIEALFPPGAIATDLFVEAPNVFIPVAKPQGELENGRQRFVVNFASKAEAEAVKGKPLTLTLVWDEGGRETTWTVD